MQPPPLFSAKDIGKRFGHRHILRGLSFAIQQGEFLLLLGANGAGKSTLLRIISSLMRPSTGQLEFNGRPYAAAGAELRGSIGMVSHESHLYGDLTARENLRVFGGLYGVEALGRRIPAVLKEMRLDAYPDVPVRAFSSGMTKRLALGRLALYEPRILLLDEPYSGLDQESVQLLDGFLLRFKEGGGTTLMVTHQLARGASHCTHLMILHQGRLVYNQPATDLTGDDCAALLEEYTHSPHPTENNTSHDLDPHDTEDKHSD